jgi:hypothetical protein
MARDPNLLTTSTNRNLFQPTRDNKTRKRSEIRESLRKGKNRSNSRSREWTGAIKSNLTQERSMSETSHSDRSQLVDLVVEDTEAEEAERVRARKEGGDFWNQDEQKHFVRTYDPDCEAAGEQIREGFDVRELPEAEPPEFAVGEDEGEGEGESDRELGGSEGKPQYGSLNEEREAWDSSSRHLWHREP